MGGKIYFTKYTLCNLIFRYECCGHFVELSLCSGEALAGPGCFCWKSNWTKFDHLGSTRGHWETVSGSFFISFGNGLEVPSQYAFNFSFSRYLREERFYLSLMIQCNAMDHLPSKLSKFKLAICSQEVNSIFRGLQTGSVNVAHAPYLPVGSNSTIGH